jgi:Xaa-Pro aminopeptidase
VAPDQGRGRASGAPGARRDAGSGLRRGAASPAPRPAEHELFAALHGSLLAELEEPLLLAGNLASGLRTALADPRATARRIEAGDLVLVDLYPVLDGYAVDFTRTFVVGEPTRLQQERHAVLIRALGAAETLLRPGIEVRRIDAAIREVLADAGGYDRTMQHHAGHGIGLLAWEVPWIGPGTEGCLQSGDAIAIEPGLYLPEWGGMRVEGNYLVTDAGVERLDAFPRALIPVSA